MSGLFGVLNTALSSLSVSQDEISTTSNNVANANTPGYSRQVAEVAAGAPISLGSISYGTGVVLQTIQSIRDSVLEIQLNTQTQQQSKLDTSLAQLQQLETHFGSAKTGIGADISNFFNTLQQLSPDPSNLALRQSVISAASTLASDFNSTAASLQTQRSNIDLNVVQSVNQVNALATEIASVNKEISTLQNAGENPGTLLDKRANLVRQLSGLIDIAVIPTDQGISVAASNGTTLVSGPQSYVLTTGRGSDGVQQVVAALYSAPSCAQYTGGQVLCMARNATGGLSWTLYNGSTWSAFKTLKAAAISAPSCATDNNNEIVCSVFATTGVTLVTRFAAGVFSPFLNVGGTAGGEPDCVSMDSNGNVACFAKAYNSGIYINVFKGGTWAIGDWSGYLALGGGVNDNAGCATQAAGELLCGAVGVLDNAFYANAYNGTNWTGWQKIGGSGVGSPSCAALGSGKVVCAVMGPNNKITSVVGP